MGHLLDPRGSEGELGDNDKSFELFARCILISFSHTLKIFYLMEKKFEGYA